MKNELGFAIGGDLSRAERLYDPLASFGVPEEDHPWFADALVESGCVPDDGDAVAVLDQLGRSPAWFRLPLGGRDEAALRIVVALDAHLLTPVPLFAPGSARGDWPITLDSLQRFAHRCVKEGVDFTSSLKAVACPQAGIDTRERARIAIQTARALGKHGLLAPERLCDLARLESLAGSVRWYGDWSSADANVECSDPTSPTFWAAVGADDLWRCVEGRLREPCDDDAASRLAHGLAVTAHRLGHGLAPISMPTGSHLLVERMFIELDARVGEEPRKASELLRRTWMRLSQELRGGYIDSRPGCRKRLESAADYELGWLRCAVREAPPETAADDFERALPWFQAAASILFERSLFHGMRPLLLLLRELRYPAVGPDMRYRSVQGRDQPRPWSAMPEALISLFHGCASTAQKDDADLLDLRTRLARFCLERLSSKVPGGPPLEPDARWRWAYIQAARELRVNPDGRGHHILNFARQSDPHDAVKKAAREAYAELRHGPTLPPDRKPRRVVIDALVYLFQAHYLCVAPEARIDDPGVERTRRELARRTAEPSWERPDQTSQQ